MDIYTNGVKVRGCHIIIMIILCFAFPALHAFHALQSAEHRLVGTLEITLLFIYSENTSIRRTLLGKRDILF